VVSLLRTALDRMKDALPKAEHMRIAPDGLDPWREAVRIIQAYEIWQVYGRFVEEKRPKFGPGVAERMKIASTVTAAQADAARAVRAKARERILGMITPGTIVALPTAPSIAPLIDMPAAALETHRLQVMRLTCTAGLAGLPQVTIPAGTASGCPAGLSFIGWAGGDEILLELAVALSSRCGIAA
jgi:amidase